MALPPPPSPLRAAVALLAWAASAQSEQQRPRSPDVVEPSWSSQPANLFLPPCERELECARRTTRKSSAGENDCRGQCRGALPPRATGGLPPKGGGLRSSVYQGTLPPASLGSPPHLRSHEVLVWIRSSDAPRALPLPAASLLAELELFVADTAGAAAEAPPGALPWRDPGCAGGLPSYVACLERGCLENAGAPLNGGAAWSRLVEEACQGELAELDLASPDREVPSSRPQRHHRD
ncbi:unnamed protein product, partial [Prorocentrum cordatum]